MVTPLHTRCHTYTGTHPLPWLPWSLFPHCRGCPITCPLAWLLWYTPPPYTCCPWLLLSPINRYRVTVAIISTLPWLPWSNAPIAVVTPSWHPLPWLLQSPITPCHGYCGTQTAVAMVTVVRHFRVAKVTVVVPVAMVTVTHCIPVAMVTMIPVVPTLLLLWKLLLHLSPWEP